MSSPEQSREQSFARLYAQTHADVLRFVQRRAAPGQVEDIVSEAFLTTWRRFDDVPTRLEDARAWLFGTARNCLLNSRRGHTRREALGVHVADITQRESETDEADAVSRRVDLAAAWKRLRPAEQEVLSLAVWEDLTSPQAGRVLGISSTAYRLRLHRARHALRRQLEPSIALARPMPRNGVATHD